MARRRTVSEIDAQIAKLQQERAEAHEAEKAGVVSRMKEAIAYYDITAAELGYGNALRNGRKARGAASKAKRGRGRIKFKDDAGHTWSGFGRRPKWLADALASGKSEADLRA